MAGDDRRDWTDTASKLLIPVVIALTGILYTAHNDSVGNKRALEERDSGYLKMMASQNEKERDLGLKIVLALRQQKQFSPSLEPVAEALAGAVIENTRPSDPASQLAQSLKSDLAANSGAAATPAANSSVSRVYMQIAREDQRAGADELRADLINNGFAVQLIQLVSQGTTNNYIRFFSDKDESKQDAQHAQEVLKKIGVAATIQDFAALNKGNIPSRQIEIWIGDKQGALPR